MNQRPRAACFWALLALCLSCARSPPHAWRTEPLTRGPITEVVNATGNVEAIITVNVGSQVSGTVLRRYVDFNSIVKKGQLIAELDPRLLRRIARSVWLPRTSMAMRTPARMGAA